MNNFNSIQVTAKGAGLNKFFPGRPAAFQIDTGLAGTNLLMVGVVTTKGPCEEVVVRHQGSGHYVCSYRIPDRVKGFVFIKYGDKVTLHEVNILKKIYWNRAWGTPFSRSSKTRSTKRKSAKSRYMKRRSTVLGSEFSRRNSKQLVHLHIRIVSLNNSGCFSEKRILVLIYEKKNTFSLWKI